MSQSYELCAIALSDIDVRDGHNPRTSFDAVEHRRLVAAIKDRGFRHPIEVTQADGDGRFTIVDGERRFRAAREAGLDAIPALVKPADPDEAGDLIDAILANDLSVKLDVLAEAKAYDRLRRDGGLTRKGIAERCHVPPERVRERLLLLMLPEALQQQVASGDVPLRAVRPLVSLAEIHVDLPAVAVERVQADPPQPGARKSTWLDLERDPISVVIGVLSGQHEDLPDGVYAAACAYPATTFALDESVNEQAAELRELLGIERPADLVVRFDETLVQQAEALGAAHRARAQGEALIVGGEVGAQLAGDYIARCLDVQRDQTRQRAERTTATGAGGDDDPLHRDHVREQRESEHRARKAAELRNELLGRAIVKHLSKVKVDGRVLKILTAASLSRDLRQIATRGARYGFPGWISAQQSSNGRSKSAYLPPNVAEEKAREYLAGASSAADVAGRSLALLAMARWADELSVAQSYRSNFALRLGGYGADVHGVPWRCEAETLLDEILLERLPADATAPIRQSIAEREAQTAEGLTGDRRTSPTDSASADTVDPDDGAEKSAA